jgi:hypothetical protein
VHLAAAFAALKACETGANATADVTCLTTTHADGLSGHLLSRAGLLGRASGWELHLLGLGLLNFLGRHIGNMEDSGVQKDVADAIGWVVMK